MGYFDFECGCLGEHCDHMGGQNHWESTVIIEVPLSDGTVVYLKGRYNGYGVVEIGNYKFYAEQFRDFLPSWLSDITEDELSKSFKANEIWTFKHTMYIYEDDEKYDPDNMANNTKVETCECFDYVDGDVSKMTPQIIEKCIPIKKKEPLRRKLRT
jgi:hypothetical protein